MAEVMVEVGGLLAAAVLKVVGDQIGSAIGGQITLQQNFTKDLEKMKMALESVEALLKDAERRSIDDAAVRLWLRRLKDAMYDISDLIDEFEEETKEGKPDARKTSLKGHLLRLASLIPCLTIAPKIKLANKMKEEKDKLKEITDQHKSFSFKVGPSSTNELKAIDVRETSSVVGDKTLIVGRKVEEQQIVASLFERMTQGITILPIYGIGGIGKTTLAKLVFNSTQFKEYSQVWVYVSQIFELNKIGNSIISQLSEEQSQLPIMQMIHNQLAKLLTGKKVLIVLDDMWEQDQSKLDCLVDMMKVGEDSKVVVIVTTRDEGIARRISTIQPYKIAPLTDDLCWDIIKQKSAFESRDDKEQLKQIGMDIAMKCVGVALAAQCIGHMLGSMNSGEWESVRNSSIWNVSASQDTSSQHHSVLASLRLSYSCMPSHLKLCFAYCAIFPKGHKMVKDDLIHQWDSLGFIEAPSILSTRQHGEKYIRQLLGLSFLQHSKSQNLFTGEHHDDVILLTMHDLVHDLARLVMVDEILDVSKQGYTGGRSCRYALLNDCSKPLESSMNSPSKIRVMRFMDCGKIGLHDAAFSSAKYLRVLDLSECFVEKLPDSIGELKQLRYLNVPGVQHRVIPNGITKLLKLIYLSLCGSSAILELPKSIGEMEGLMHLDLSGCSGLEKLPESFGKLKKLAHLDLSKCTRVTCISESLESLTNLKYLNLSYCMNIGKLPDAMGILLKLQYLNLSYGSYVDGRSEVEALGTLTKLEYLNLASDSSDVEKLPEALSYFMNLKYLNLSGFKKMKELPASFGNLKTLMHLDLSQCSSLEEIPQVLGGLTKLHYLNLSRCRFKSEKFHLMAKVMGKFTKLQYLNLSSAMVGWDEVSPSVLEFISSLTNLEHLDLSHNKGLHNVPDCFGTLRKLHTLEFSGCDLLMTVPASVGEIDTLKFIHVNGCHLVDISTLPRSNRSVITLPRFMVQAYNDDSNSNLALLQEVNPTDLQITNLQSVKSVNEAQNIKLVGKQGIKELGFEWTIDAERFVEDLSVLGALVPPSTLERFKIKGYSSIRFPGWLMGISPYSFTNLVRFSMKNLPKCISLPPLGQLPSLKSLSLKGMQSIAKIDGDFCGGPRAFPRLVYFTLSKMEGLEEWNTKCDGDGTSEFMFPNLDCLKIFDCPKLRLKPCLPRAVSWDLSGCDNVISSWAESVPHADTPSSSSPPMATRLNIRNCQVTMHQWRLLQHLPPLRDLVIVRCSDLSISPEITRALSSLQHLSLYGEDHARLPDWLDQLTSLKELRICGYEVNASQETGMNLTSLQELHLDRYESMTSLPQWVGDLTSLQELTISSCRNLSSHNLQETIGRLTSLKKLSISWCAGINSLPEGMEKFTNLKCIRINGVKYKQGGLDGVLVATSPPKKS